MKRFGKRLYNVLFGGPKKAIGPLLILVIIVFVWLLSANSHKHQTKVDTDPTSYGKVTDKLVDVENSSARQKLITDYLSKDLSNYSEASKVNFYIQVGTLACGTKDFTDATTAYKNAQAAAKTNEQKALVYLQLARCESSANKKEQAKPDYLQSIKYYKMLKATNDIKHTIAQAQAEVAKL